VSVTGIPRGAVPRWPWSSSTRGLPGADAARLVAAGLPARLLLSAPTVTSHLTHICTKLGISDRAELAAQAARRTTG